MDATSNASNNAGSYGLVMPIGFIRHEHACALIKPYNPALFNELIHPIQTVRAVKIHVRYLSTRNELSIISRQVS